MLAAGRKPTDVTHVFFSHFHFDHCLDYPSLVLTRWDQDGGNAPDLKVYGPPPLLGMNALLFGPDGVYGPDIRARTSTKGSLARYVERGGQLPRRPPVLDAAEITPGHRIKVGDDCVVTAAAAVHAEPYLTCLSYRLDTPDGSIVYTGDTAPNDRLVALARGCDILIHLCAYLSGSDERDARSQSASGHLEAADTARAAAAGHLILTHIGPKLDVAETRERMLAEISEIYPGKVSIAEDLMAFDLKRGAGARR